MDLKLQARIAATMWQGLELDERPEQGPSPFPYLTVCELLAVPLVYPAYKWSFFLPLDGGIPKLRFKSWKNRVAASRTARSDAGASTERLPATAAMQQIKGKSTAFDLRFSDLRRCSTADQSGVPDFEDFPDGH